MRNLYLAAILVTAVLAPTDSLIAQQRPKSESTAVLLSLGGTALPYAMRRGGQADPYALVAMAIVGPSLGHFYAGRPGRALAGASVRVAALAGMAAGFAAVWEDDSQAGAALLVGGMGVFIVSSLYDIGSAPASVRGYNKQHPMVSVVPIVQGGRARLALAARFSF